jgi:hypothetical protein
MAGPAPFSKNGTQFFPQNVSVDLLCGQYSLNHLLQEEKIVWRPDEPFLIGGNNPLDSNVKINYWVVCKEHYKKLTNLLGNNAKKNAMSKCQMDRGEKPGMFPIDSFGIVLDMLNLENNTIVGTRREQDRKLMRDALNVGFDKPNFLGAILTNGAHYIAIVKYTSACKDKFAIIDSLSCSTHGANCVIRHHVVTHAMEYMAKTGGAVLVYANTPDAYAAVSVKRMRGLDVPRNNNLETAIEESKFQAILDAKLTLMRQAKELIDKPNWIVVWDNDNNTYYYYNTVTKKTIWEWPPLTLFEGLTIHGGKRKTRKNRGRTRKARR